MNHGAWRSLLVVFVLFFVWAAAPAQAQDPGPMFLVIALDDGSEDGTGEFDVTDIKERGKDAGSDTIIIKVGTLTGGDGGATDVTLTSDDPSFTVPKVGKEYLNLLDLDGNEATYFGTYEVYPYSGSTDLEPHMLTTSSAAVSPYIQAAVFAAATALENAIAVDPFMKTGEIAGIVFDELQVPSGVTKPTLDQVAVALFGPDGTASTDPTLDDVTGTETGATPTVECDGQLFPHEESVKLFDFTFSVKKDTTSTKGKWKFALDDLVRNVDVEVKEASVDLQKQGNVPIVVYGPKADEIDVGTVRILGEAPAKTSLSDENDDGILDLLCHFSVPELVENDGADGGGYLTTSTKKVTLTGMLKDGKTQIVGTADINTK